jgi:ribonuclease VapC
MFVDASAMVAIITSEPEADVLAAALEQADAPITSAIAIFEAVLGIARKYRRDMTKARGVVMDFLAAARVRTVPIGDREAQAALGAFARYGKGRGHRAQLNLGDCFAYAVAAEHNVTLLYIGNDFSRTDVRSAIASD